MGRWEPDAAGRLRAAALDLYAERGYDQTTVAEIAERAGVTSRTFFRHFGDKREVLFAGSDTLLEAMSGATRDAAPEAGPMDAVGAALDASAELIGFDQGWSRRRRRIIEAHPELQERELSKMSSLADALADALRERGVKEPTATLAAEAGACVFRVGFDQWTAPGEDRDLRAVLRDSLERLRAAAR